MAKIQCTYVKTEIQISSDKQEILGQVIVGDEMQSICMQGNTTMTVPDKINK